MNGETFSMGKQDIAWCPGCGNFGIHRVLKMALEELGLIPQNTVLVSGIGQAAKMPQYIKSNYFNGLHGRSLDPAVAIKSSNPNLNVIVTSGDGDMYGEGGNHFLHTIRRNPNITVIVHDNMIYGLTKGQASPTTEKGMKTPVQTTGVVLEPFNPIAASISLDASFVARASITDIAQTKELIKKAIQHKGFSLVDIFQPCVTFNKINTYEWFRDNTYYVDDAYNPRDRNWAFAKATETDKFALGVLYLAPDKPVFEDLVGIYEKNKDPLYKRSLNKEKLRKLCGREEGIHRFEGKIVRVVQETHDVKSFYVERPKGFVYFAGQYAMVGFADKRKVGGKLQIPLTFSSSPTQNEVCFTFKDMGTFSSELYQLKEGDSLIVNGPLGECFNVTSFSEEDFIFLSGGTGVTPFISIFKFLQDKKMNNKVTMINANKTYDDIIMRERLDTLSQDDKYFIMNTLDSADDSWGGERGFISKEMIEKYVQNYADKRFLICGPPPMVASLRAVLKELGVADENVCFDNWQLPGKSQKEN